MGAFSLMLSCIGTIFASQPLRSFQTAIMVSLAGAALGAFMHSAKGHTHLEADGGTVSWYPPVCCNNGDCRPVARVRRGPEGLWMTTVDGLTMLVGPNDKRLPSRDMRWHICIGVDDTETQKIRCIFEPPQS
jgi:hypothetical protein